jgi:hypothetical protein
MCLNSGNAWYYLFCNIVSRFLFYKDVTIVWIKMLSSLLFCVGVKLGIIRTAVTENVNMWTSFTVFLQFNYNSCYYAHYLMYCWPCIIVYQYSETNVMHVSFNLLRNKSLYMCRALLVHPQEVLHKQHLVYCLRVMSVDCTRCSQLT